MKPNFDLTGYVQIETPKIQGFLHIENTSKVTILRYVYKWNESKCLLRIYESKLETKTIVIVSQLDSTFVLDEGLIPQVVQDFELAPENLIWINHISLCSDGISSKEEKFLKTSRSCHKSYRSKTLKCEKIESTKILGWTEVEEVIERSLEPVETWKELDPALDIHNERELLEKLFQLENKEEERREEQKTRELFKLCVKSVLNFLTEAWVREKSKLEAIEGIPLRGALFYYPESPEGGKQKLTRFFQHQDLKNLQLDESESCLKVALPYVNNYDAEKEIVICLQFNDQSVFCDIFPAKF